MKVYFHIGTEKTGSSHLQSTAAINRQQLKEEGIWFPNAGKREDHLLKGEISAGNAQNITDFLNNDDLKSCGDTLAAHIENAKKHECHSLFLSNELMVLALAKKNKLKQLNNLLKQNGCLESKYLIILRDPVSKALSLFKHRAKNNPISNIERWLQEGYLYGTRLLSFFKEADQEGINLTCRKFSKISGALNTILFNDWLGVNTQLKRPPQVVNPSLSLSELSLLKKVRDRHPYLANVLYEKLLAIEKGLKAEDSSIEQYHKAVLSNHLVQFEETWRVCNNHLPDSEQLAYPTSVDLQFSADSVVSSFSDVQLDEISDIIVDSLSLQTKLDVEWLKWRGRLGKLIYKVFK